MNVLIIAPHPDDEALGCGGTVCKHSAGGDRVAAVFLTSGELGLKQLPRDRAWRVRESEARKAARILGIKRIEFLRLPDWHVGQHIKEGARLLRPVLKREAPEVIYLPHPGDWHPDHQAAWLVLQAAWGRGSAPPPKALGYEVWTPLSAYDQVENITKVMSRKIRALRAHRSQLDEFDYERAVRGLNQFRGELAGKCRYAEVFQVLSWKMGAS